MKRFVAFLLSVFVLGYALPGFAEPPFDERELTARRFQYGELPQYLIPQNALNDILEIIDLSTLVLKGERIEDYIQRMKDMGWKFRVDEGYGTYSFYGQDTRIFKIITISKYARMRLWSEGTVPYEDDDEEFDEDGNYIGTGESHSILEMPEVEDTRIKYADMVIVVPIKLPDRIYDKRYEVPIDLDRYSYTDPIDLGA